MIAGLTFWERARNWWPILLPLVLLAGTYWLNQQVLPLTVAEQHGKRHEIDYSMENLSSVTLNEQGQARYMMAAEKMWHFQDDDMTHLKTPRFVSLANPAAPMVTWAATGKVSAHGDEVFLYDAVKIMRLSDEQTMSELETSYLHFVPAKDLADTDQPVTLVTAHDTIHAIGMTLDNATRTLNLLSNVQATHEATLP